MVRASAGYLLNTIILLIVLNIGLAVYFCISDAYLARHPEQVFLKNPALRENLKDLYPSMTEAEVARLLEETWSRPVEPQAFTGFGEAPYRGKYVNVSDHGYRVGANQGPWPPAHEGNFVVFLFGGSTTFSYGVTDDQALGSRLQPLLEKKLGRPVTVYNFGQCYYFSTQERLLFEKLIMAGQRPDLVIFVDGPNDFHATGMEVMFAPALAHPVESDSPVAPTTWSVWLRQAIRLLPMTRLAGVVRDKLQSAAPRRAAVGNPSQSRKFDEQGALQKSIDRYFLNKQLIEDEAKGLSIRTLFVWEPVPLYDYDLKYDPFAEDDFGRHTYSKYGYPLMRDIVTRTPPDNFLWCADIQKDVHEPLYVDRTHFTPKMIEMVAGCIADGVH